MLLRPYNPCTHPHSRHKHHVTQSENNDGPEGVAQDTPQDNSKRQKEVTIHFPQRDDAATQ